MQKLLPFVALLCSLSAQADIRLPKLISDNIVLQRDSSINLWGYATAGEQIIVQLNDAVLGQTRAENGQWQFTLPAQQAIALIKQHSRIVNLDSGIDYRLRTLEQAEIYHFPLDQQAETNLLNYFNALSSEPRQHNTAIEVANRQIKARHEADGVVWFSFSELCESARSQYDYMELSRLYHTVLLSGVKPMGRHNEDVARRFIALVDEFYERSVKLIISAEVKLELLYSDGILSFEFKRCISRLQEMQSHDYLAKPHLP